MFLSLDPLATSISEIINVEHENRCKIAGFEKFKMQISQDAKGLECWRRWHSIELFKLYNRFFENILMQSLAPLAASISEINNVEHENSCKIAGFENFKMQISQETKGLEYWSWCHSIESFKLYNRYFQKILKILKKIENFF